MKLETRNSKLETAQAGSGIHSDCAQEVKLAANGTVDRRYRVKTIPCGECRTPFKSYQNARHCSESCWEIWWQKHKRERVIARLFSKVQKTEGCWNWIGKTKNRDRYGMMRAFDRTVWQTHRLSWFLHFGPIPDGLWVLHECDNPACIRPDHLFLGTVQDNVDDCVSKGRNARGEMCRKKLREVDVIEILRLLKEGQSLRQLGRQFNVKYTTISHIKTGYTWKHLTSNPVAA